MTPEQLDTAHEYWDEWWGEAKTRSRWTEADLAVTAFIPVLQARGAKQVMDVGTGIGRHALAYARGGFDVTATDASSTGLEELVRSAAAQNLDVEVHEARFTELPVEDASKDHVLAWNVLYHGDGDVVQKAFNECRRVLRSDGTFQLTMLSKRNRAFGIGNEVRPDTFVDESSKGDKDHPHFYVDAEGLTRMLADSGFAVISLVDVDQGPPEGAFHWVTLAEAVR
jgi:ubiquinone/menaquinone biosynthesis C-methylase UbiE